MNSSSLCRIAFTCAAALLASHMLAAGADAQTVKQAAQTTPAKGSAEAAHKVAIQVNQNDKAVMDLALNNAKNIIDYYKEKGEKIEIEFVAYGAGLNMMRNDNSPVKERLTAIAANMKNVTFTGCGNTLANQSKQEKKEISLVPEARIVPTGIGRIVDLEEQGWTYVRP